MKKLVIAVLWLACSYVNYGLTLGSLTQEFPNQYNTMGALGVAVVGPFGLPAVLLVFSPYHWRTIPLTKEERWKAFHEMYPNLTREYFEREN